VPPEEVVLIEVVLISQLAAFEEMFGAPRRIRTFAPASGERSASGSRVPGAHDPHQYGNLGHVSIRGVGRLLQRVWAKCGHSGGMTNSTELAAALEAYIRDEVARQLDHQLALHVESARPPAQPAAPDDVRWLTIREAAKRVGRHEDTVRKACQAGELFAKQRGKHGRWAIRPSSLDAWMDGTPDPHREAVERWQRGPKQPLKPRRTRRPTARPETDPEGPAAA